MGDKKRGHLFVISAPSGTGKTSLVKAVVEKDPTISLAISTTTRKPRQGEIDGKDYFFVSRNTFEKKEQNNEFLEWAFVYGNFYGTSLSTVEECLENKKNIILEIDWQGALQVKKKCHPSEVSLVFIKPPSLKTLKARLEMRGQDSQSTIQKRLRLAKTELLKSCFFDYVIINGEFDRALKELYELIENKMQ